jgi:hypothetical protein
MSIKQVSRIAPPQIPTAKDKQDSLLSLSEKSRNQSLTFRSSYNFKLRTIAKYPFPTPSIKNSPSPHLPHTRNYNLQTDLNHVHRHQVHPAEGLLGDRRVMGDWQEHLQLPQAVVVVHQQGYP